MSADSKPSSVIFNDDASEQRKNPTTFNPLVQAIIGERFRFRTEAQAIERLKRISTQFETLSGDNVLPVTLWIRGYELTPEEEQKGYLGNFALLRAKQLEDGLYTVYATKVEIDLSEHPRKKRPKHKHPNWGHPVLRRIHAEEEWESVDAARWGLINLHEEFPEISIPASEDRLYIIVYDKTLIDKGEMPILKIILDVEPRPEGRAFIKWRPNSRVAKPAGTKKTTDALAIDIASMITGGRE